MKHSEKIKLRAASARKLFDSEIRKEMENIVLKIAENAKRRKSRARRDKFEKLWAEHAMLEHIADNDREDVSVDDAVAFYWNSVKFIGECLINGKASESAMTVHNDL